MGYIAYLDYEHLDNSLFLKSLAEATASQDSGIVPRIFVHSDSEYTERLIQTGMMRDDARSRAIRELNRQLVALFADYGVSAIGLNGYQRKIASFNPDSDELTIDHGYLSSLPSVSILIISNLVHIVGEDEPQLFPVQRYLSELTSLPDVSQLYVFSSGESPSESNIDRQETHFTTKPEKKGTKMILPRELIGMTLDSQIISISEFSQIPY
ncbi:MAG TPA: hypothetical protein VKA08_10280 [Balneolales bacterium]|nr:hypothetical protein [Balneolales bacterium]